MKWLTVLLVMFFLAGCGTSRTQYEYKLSDFVKGDGTPFVKIDNPLARDVSFDELNIFLQEYNLGEHPFANSPNSCGWFAENLHNTAEARGIRAAIVEVLVSPNYAHSLNLFQTELGHIYIDATEGIVSIAVKEGTEYKVIKENPLNQIRIQQLGQERGFLVFW